MLIILYPFSTDMTYSKSILFTNNDIVFKEAYLDIEICNTVSCI
jgi:hypothetical protein